MGNRKGRETSKKRVMDKEKRMPRGKESVPEYRNEWRMKMAGKVNTGF